MSTVITHPAVDAVVLGQGALGGDITVKLATAGYKVVGLDKGPYWEYATDFAPIKYDEWGISWNRKFDHPLTLSTFTMRNNVNQFALPVRRYTSGQVHSGGHGVGGATQHYGGDMGRYADWVYTMYSSTVSRYGLPFLNAAVPNQDIFDYPYTNGYTDVVPYYLDWEQAWGITGTNENPFMPMAGNFPMPPAPLTPTALAYQAATEALGYNPIPAPTSLASQPYVNQYGIQVNECLYDGWCGEGCNYPCEVGAKANSAYRTIPAAIATGNLDLRVNSYVFRLDTNSSGQIIDVRYYDAMGNIHIQPATVFANALWGYNVVRLLALSGIGTNYNPATVTGTLGRGIAQPTGGPSRSATGTVAIGGNSYPSGNGKGGAIQILDLADDNYDHTGKNYIGGSRMMIGIYMGSGPGNLAIAGSSSAANIGSKYKASQQNKYLVTKQTLSFAPSGMFPSVTTNYADLDPHYTDLYGDPLIRQTMDVVANGTNCSNDQAAAYEAILTKMGATNVTLGAVSAPLSSHITNWSAHTRGGARIGTDPSTSVFNAWGQHWNAVNLFAAGEITLPNGDNVTTGGTHPAGASALIVADGIKQYLATPGALLTGSV
jgi:gluconate 2-dehydrogenase alpha chain